MPLGPNRAPGRYEVPVSKGAPIALSDTETSSLARSLTDERNVEFCMSVQTRAVWQTAERRDPREHGIGLARRQLILQSQHVEAGVIPEYRRHQEECCTTVPHAGLPMALDRGRDRREQLLLQRSRKQLKRASLLR
jgi:hypothetical protein